MSTSTASTPSNQERSHALVTEQALIKLEKEGQLCKETSQFPVNNNTSATLRLATLRRLAIRDRTLRRSVILGHF